MAEPTRTRTIGAGAALGLLGTILAANAATEHLGFVPVGFGATATAGTLAAGLALGLRDIVQDTLGRPAAGTLAAEARARGLSVHMGRVNSARRLGLAQWIGADTVDGTYLAFGPTKNLPRLLGWMGEIERQPMISLA